ncbi:MAG TPA: type II toxin-antitoxin system VapC family toxin [Candidatus Paceibacterota bacterium]|nr:type II toxin-antitoxin system VapC family toxin [Candidatus Paceibacterota bacterium]
MLYLDTSSLLKLLLPEPESDRVQEAIAGEREVLVSALVELEAEVQLRGGWLGGTFTGIQYRRLVQRLHELPNQEPFEFRSLPGTLFRTALQQMGTRERQHLRTLDRLHLAAMQELDVRRLMTHDLALGQAAGALGYEVLTPGL